MKSIRTKGNATARRKRVLAFLRKQLVDGVKHVTIREKNFAGILAKKETDVPLTDADKKRISSEIKILESRV